MYFHLNKIAMGLKPVAILYSLSIIYDSLLRLFPQITGIKQCNKNCPRNNPVHAE